ncbi:hypothetical protein H7U16_09175 [Klebsiella pneumoniae]|uniref:Uncharacterized protein n=1 Tax=Klebsiella pneumoniae TaxID=573 RepID=A0A7X1HSL6_KLEPN|nr:hypothetical protein [Klebsiella pneumoniae]
MILDAAKDIASCKQDKSIKLTSNAPISTLAAVTASSRLRSGSPELTLVLLSRLPVVSKFIFPGNDRLLGVGRFDGITKKHISKNPLTDNAATGFW